MHLRNERENERFLIVAVVHQLAKLCGVIKKTFWLTVALYDDTTYLYQHCKLFKNCSQVGNEK